MVSYLENLYGSELEWTKRETKRQILYSRYQLQRSFGATQFSCQFGGYGSAEQSSPDLQWRDPSPTSSPLALWSVRVCGVCQSLYTVQLYWMDRGLGQSDWS